MNFKQRGVLHIALLLILALPISGCRDDPVPQRDFGSSDLLIDLSVLPTNWEAYPPRLPFEEESLAVGDSDDMVVVFSEVGGIPNAGRHYVFRLGSIEEAERLYDRKVYTRFSGWFQPEALVFFSPYTNRLYSACTVSSGSQRCMVMAQYEEFVTVFHAAVDPGVMTLDEFDAVVQQIDWTFASLLDLQPLQSGDDD
jgi:hypothetical protein